MSGAVRKSAFHPGRTSVLTWNCSRISSVPTALSIPTNITAGRGSIVSVPINVDTLSGTDASRWLNRRVFGGQFVVEFNPAAFSVSSVTLGTVSTGGDSTTIGKGYSPTAPNKWSIATTTTSPAGYLYIDLSSGDGSGAITGAGTGTLVNINFQVTNARLPVPSRIDLAADSGGGAFPATSLISFTTSFPYKLTPAPVDNTTLGPPYSYSTTPADPSDGTVTVTGTVQPPTLVNQLYNITERAVAGDPALSVASPGVLQGATDPQGLPLTVVAGSLTPVHGSLSLNSNGSFVYTPNTGFLGTDSFSYTASDNLGASATATVALTVTPRLSCRSSRDADPLARAGDDQRVAWRHDQGVCGPG